MWRSVQGFTRSGQPDRARRERRPLGAPGSPPGVSHEAATEGVRVHRIGVALLPLTSDRDGAALDWPKARRAPDLATTRLERPPSNEAAPPDACSGRGARSIRGRARGSHSIAPVGRFKAPRASRKLARRAALPTIGTSAPRTHRLWRDDGERGPGAPTPGKARPAGYGARRKVSEAGSCPFPRTKTPWARVRCPEGASIKAPHRIG